MRRQLRARWLAAASAAVVVATSALFALLRNPLDPMRSGEDSAQGLPAVPAETVMAGAAAFDRLGCTRCHSIAGSGSPAIPLDGIGRRLDAAAIRDWALGEGQAAVRLPSHVIRVKVLARDDPDLPVLIEYLASLR
jgi:hypothetical protein